MDEHLIHPKQITLTSKLLSDTVNRNGTRYSAEAIASLGEQMKTGVQVNISPELVEDGYHDIIGKITEGAMKMAAKKLEEKLFAEIDEQLKGSFSSPYSAGPTTGAGGPLTKEDLEKAMQAVIDAPIMPVSEGYGLGLINKNGIAQAKSINTDPRLTDIVIMREFAELGSPYNHDDLRAVAREAVGQEFDVDWLIQKYPQGMHLKLYHNKEQVFVVEEAAVRNHEKEKAVFATGSIRGKNWRQYQQGTPSRGKRGMAGQAIAASIGGGLIPQLGPMTSFSVEESTQEEIDAGKAARELRMQMTFKPIMPVDRIIMHTNLTE